MAGIPSISRPLVIVASMSVVLVVGAARFGADGAMHKVALAQAPAVTAYHTSPGVADPSRVPQHGVFEVTLAQASDYGGQRNESDVDLRVSFARTVGGQTWSIGGFYYGKLANGTGLWKARFAPPETGHWAYRYTFTHTPIGRAWSGSGAFEAVPGAQPGFLRLNPAQPFQLRFDNGQPFAPIGFNDCFGPSDQFQLDGGDRVGAFAGTTSTDEYLATYGQAGFNLFRLSPSNCSPDLVDAGLTTYDFPVAQSFDRLIAHARAHGFRIFYGLFGYRLPDNPTDPPPPDVERFVKYSVNRWSALVDVWELENERSASDGWIDAVARIVRETDPYDHPVTTSWERPEHPAVEINAPHWYQTEDPLHSDLETANRATEWRRAGKPVIVGEQGNSSPPGDPYGNWLPDSALRMRLRSWAALFSEISLVFWNNSWATNGSGGGAANLYLGPEERQVVQVIQRFAGIIGRTDMAHRPTEEIRGLDRQRVRGYLLRAEDVVALYLHHTTDHADAVTGQRITIDVAQAGSGIWLDPASGAVLATVRLMAGPNTLDVPAFVVDLAFLSTGEAALAAPPIAVVAVTNPQADGDLDDDGQPDRGPRVRPFGMPPLTLTLDGRGSIPFGGVTLRYRWHFGDGTPDAEGAVATHTYADGHYLTTLTVTDAAGRSARASLAVRASADPNTDRNDPPTLNPYPDVTAREGELVLVSPVGSDRELVAGRYLAPDRHDNAETLTFQATDVPPGAAFEPWRGTGNPQLWWVPGFDQQGSYTITFQVADPDGATSAPGRVRITVLDAPAASTNPFKVLLPYAGRS